MLRRYARRFLLEDEKLNMKIYYQAAEPIETNDNLLVKQTRIKSSLNGLWIEHFMEYNVDVVSGLAMVYKRILTFSR